MPNENEKTQEQSGSASNDLLSGVEFEYVTLMYGGKKIKTWASSFKAARKKVFAQTNGAIMRHTKATGNERHRLPVGGDKRSKLGRT